MRAVLVSHDHRNVAQLTLALRALDVSVDHVACLSNSANLTSTLNYNILVVDADGMSDRAIAELEQLDVSREVVKFVCVSRESLGLVRRFLEIGFDDFLLKSMDRDELHLRLGRIANRTLDSQFRSLIETVGDLTIDHATREVRKGGVTVELTPRERSVLLVLLKNRSHVVSKELLADRIFRGNEEVGPAAIETYVCRLRRKLSSSSVGIRTLRGLGYVLDVSAGEQASEAGGETAPGR